MPREIYSEQLPPDFWLDSPDDFPEGIVAQNGSSYVPLSKDSTSRVVEINLASGRQINNDNVQVVYSRNHPLRNNEVADWVK